MKSKKVKYCVICNTEHRGQGVTCSMPCRTLHLKQIKLLKYGNANYNNRTKAKKTCVSKYGVENPAQVDDVKRKVTDKGRYYSSDAGRKKTREFNKSRKIPDVIKQCLNCKETFTCLGRRMQQKYCSISCKQAAKIKRFNTTPEKTFEQILLTNNIEYSKQFYLSGRWFDFKIGNILVEIDGTYWHGKGMLYDDMPDWRKRIYENDRLKDKIAAEFGFTMKRFWSDELETIKILEEIR